MGNPVLVEVTRGEFVESRHTGAVCVVDGDGKPLIEIGDVDQPVFPRSAIKVMQALPLVETGAADALGFGNRELALACASHQGEPAHVALAQSMLAKVGLDADALICGAHWPFDPAASRALARSGREPDRLHNNCSGKHSGFLCTCCHVGLPTAGYGDAAHGFQAMIRDVMEAVTGARHGADNRAIDGCSIPTYAVPIRDLATGFARLASGNGLAPARNAAVRRLFAACMAEPFHVAGTGKADTVLMGLAPGRLFVKTGAEGVYCAAVPDLGLGIALKCDDGNARGSEVMVAAVLARLVERRDADLAGRLAAFARPMVPSRAGDPVGVVRPAGALAG